MNTEQTADFAAVRHMLAGLGASWEPAEAHGAFCGRACLTGVRALKDWVHDVAGPVDAQNVLAAEHIAALQTFAADSLLKLEGGQLDFCLLLPEQDAPLEQRTTSLADWCHGFMHGLASAGGGDHGPRSDVLDTGVIKEILQDFSEITRAAVEHNNSSEVEEAFVELEEYVRVSAQLVYEETAALRGGGTPRKAEASH